MTALLAHQGGWDEILLVLAPILVIAGLLKLAKLRVERSLHDRAPEAEHAEQARQRPS
ncbi:MAG: hypothetical protein Q7V57_02690 [Actinomycetota bacterium]|nr:hypothetical protein [Actinomycetota bacterium]